MNLLNSCPNLKSLVWQTKESPDELHDLQNLKLMPNLKNLRLGYQVPLAVLEYIQAPNIQYLYLSIYHFGDKDDNAFPPIVFPCLTSLVVDAFCHKAGILEFLQNHYFLEDLEFINVDMQSSLVRYLASTSHPKSLPKLKCLTIGHEDDKSLAATISLILDGRSHRPASYTPFKLRYRGDINDTTHVVDRSNSIGYLYHIPRRSALC